MQVTMSPTQINERAGAKRRLFCLNMVKILENMLGAVDNNEFTTVKKRPTLDSD